MSHMGITLYRYCDVLIAVGLGLCNNIHLHISYLISCVSRKRAAHTGVPTSGSTKQQLQNFSLACAPSMPKKYQYAPSEFSVFC